MINFDDYLDQQSEIYWGIIDGMSEDEREAFFRERGLSSDGLPIDAELVEGADLLRTIDRSNCHAGVTIDGRGDA